jgi:hypothetical protein
MYEVNALATRSSTLLEQIANQYNIPGRYKDYRDLLDQSLDAVFILNRDHAPIIMDAAAANKQIASIDGNSLVRLHHAIGSLFRIADEMYRIQAPDDGPITIYEAEQQQINEEMFRAIGLENKAYRTAYSLLLHLWSHDLNLFGASGDR